MFIVDGEHFALDYLNMNNKSKVGVANFYGGLTSFNKNFSDLNFDFENYIKYLCKQNNVVRVYYSVSPKAINNS